MEPEAGCNGLLAQVEPAGHTSCSPAELSNGKLHDGVAACIENGPVSEIPAISTINCAVSSVEQPSPSFTGTSDELAGAEISIRASNTLCANHTITSESKPCLSNSIPLLSIPQTDHSCTDDKSFSVLPSFAAEDSTIQVRLPSVFSVPCTGKESNDVFTEVSLDDDDGPLSQGVNTLSVPVVRSTESSRDSSPTRLRLATSSSSVHLDDPIVQSVLCDDDDDNDTSHTVGSSRHSTGVAFATNTDSAAFRTPADSAINLNDDGLHVVEPDGVSFEEISLQSYSIPESRSAAPEQTAPSDSKRSSFANFFARLFHIQCSHMGSRHCSDRQ